MRGYHASSANGEWFRGLGLEAEVDVRVARELSATDAHKAHGALGAPLEAALVEQLPGGLDEGNGVHLPKVAEHGLLQIEIFLSRDSCLVSGSASGSSAAGAGVRGREGVGVL